MDRNVVIEECATVLDRAAVGYDDYASKYDDEDGRRATRQAHTCRVQAGAIRNLKSEASALLD